MKVKLLLLCVLLNAVVAEDQDHQWRLYKKAFDKSYQSPEIENSHREAFFKRLDIINDNNILADLGLKGFYSGVNQFTDRITKPQNSRRSVFHNSTNSNDLATPDLSNLPKSFDWRKKGIVNNIRNNLAMRRTGLSHPWPPSRRSMPRKLENY